MRALLIERHAKTYNRSGVPVSLEERSSYLFVFVHEFMIRVQAVELQFSFDVDQLCMVSLCNGRFRNLQFHSS